MACASHQGNCTHDHHDHDDHQDHQDHQCGGHESDDPQSTHQREGCCCGGQKATHDHARTH
ncbi:MAG: hypothetical protein HYX32_14940 [Actinobacteria bacterium]|nr:hypothetical protein [Actinomycetota bacterium]